MILHRGDIIHIHFWHGQGEDRNEIAKSYTEMFKQYGIIVGPWTATWGPASFPMQITVISNKRRNETILGN